MLETHPILLGGNNVICRLNLALRIPLHWEGWDEMATQILPHRSDCMLWTQASNSIRLKATDVGSPPMPMMPAHTTLCPRTTLWLLEQETLLQKRPAKKNFWLSVHINYLSGHLVNQRRKHFLLSILHSGSVAELGQSLDLYCPVQSLSWNISLPLTPLYYWRSDHIREL
jgi:hypothetical protein